MSNIKDNLNITLSKILSVQLDRKTRCLKKNVVKLNSWEIKDISQRELAKLTGISRSTLNDLINGKIKKVDIDDLRKIAETLDMSLQKLLKASGYDEMSLHFHAHKNKDKYIDKSSKDLKELIEQYKESETDLLQFDFTKRENARKTAFIIFDVAEHLTLLKDGKSKYTLEQAVEELNKAQNLLNPIMDKYDYKKLPKRN